MNERHAFAWALTLALTLAAAVGCIPAEAIRQARTEQAIWEGHTNDSALSEDARLIAQYGWDAWSAQRYSLEGEELPTAVSDRLRESGDLPDGYGE